MASTRRVHRLDRVLRPTLTVLILMMPVLAAQAAPPATTPRDSVVGRAEGTETLELDLLIGPEPRPFALADLLSGARMAYRFRLEVVDPVGGGTGRNPRMAVSLEVGSHGRWNRLALGQGSADLSIPRPWALELRPTDSLRLLPTTGSEGSAPIRIRLRIDFEPEGFERSRRPVDFIEAVRRSEAGGVVGSAWEWVQEQDARLISIAGLDLEGAREIELVDAERGHVVWSADLGGGIAMGRGAAVVSTVRLAVPLQGGRAYRLLVRCDCTAAAAAPRAERVIAMLRPASTP
jgi:hypothetical protein